MKKKGGELAFDTLIPWLISLGVLIFTAILYFTLSDKGNSILDYLRNIWRFGG